MAFLPMQQKWVKLVMVCILCIALVYLAIVLWQYIF